MKETTYKMQGVNGSVLHVVAWRSLVPKPVKGVIHILHGMAEHCERYYDFAKELTAHGYVVYAHDHRKHGKSVSEEQEVGVFDQKDTLENILLDIEIVEDFILKEENAQQLILIGHSMGTLLGRCYLAKNGKNISKAIFIGTTAGHPIMGRIGLSLSKIFALLVGKKRSHYLDNRVVGNFNRRIKDPRTPYDWISTDFEQVDAYISDPLCGYPYTPDFYIQLTRMIQKANTKSTLRQTPNIPMLFVSGKEDPVGLYGTGVTKVYHHYQKTGHRSEISLQLFDNARHEILNEFDKKIYYHFIINWLEV